MKQAAWLVLIAMLLGGCVAYIGPYGGRPGTGVYTNPAPVVAHGWWSWRRG